MLENGYEPAWQSLPNPFPRALKQLLPASLVSREGDTSDPITSYVSGRRTDITRIITDEQSAIFLVGSPSIGKSTLIRYLQRSPNAEWSWRNELVDLRDQIKLNDIHFVTIDLAPLEGIDDANELLTAFIRQCMKALYRAFHTDEEQLSTHSDLKELRKLLRTISHEMPDARYFVMLDAVERLGMAGMLPSLSSGNKDKTPQERGLALLDHCSAIHTLVELIDEFTIFGVILSVESLPRPKIDDQFHHVSADLARFTTMTLQAFTWDDTTAYLAQEPENFGATWSKMFQSSGGNSIFFRSEQEWLRQQAGTHPYLLQQFCHSVFSFKQEYRNMSGSWPELQESNKTQLIESINESLSTFLTHIWQRLQEAVQKSSQETKGKLYEFISSLGQKRADDIIDDTFWYNLGPELRYILYSEGIVRYDRLQPVHFPGAILCHYLEQKAKEYGETLVPFSATAGRNLTISCPGNEPIVISLSELEYRLLKTLLQHPERCKEGDLMKAAWGRLIERPAFTQRMHQLRKKLKDKSGEADLIENSYGGLYSLNHPEWLHLE